MTVPTTAVRAVPFAGGPLNASILDVPTPLPDEYAIGGPGHEAAGLYRLDPSGTHYTWHVGEGAVDNIASNGLQTRPAQDETVTDVELRPEPLATVAPATRPRRNSRRVEQPVTYGRPSPAAR